MKTLPVLAILAFVPMASAEPLSEVDRQQLLEQLDSYKKTASEQATSRMGDAAADLTAAMKSDKAALDLYLRCTEQVDFVRTKRETGDFREWKRRNKDWLDSDGFGLAARHQVRWLMLSLKASAHPESKDKLAPDALECLDAIFRSPKPLARHTGFLATKMKDTVFAKAYGLGGDGLEDWPESPIQKKDAGITIETTFDEAIFPGYRSAKDFAGLRDAWDKRIQFEEIIAGFWTGDDQQRDRRMEELAATGNHPNRAIFLRDTQPDLEWKKEMDLFRSGDEKKAAVSLVKHLKDYVTHSKAREWEAELRGAISPQEAAAN